MWGKGRGERDLSTKKKYKRPRPEGGVDKKAEIKTLDDGQKVIEYTVKFNGFTTDPVTGEFGKIPIDPKTFKLTDVFDSKLQYVSGSLYVDVYSPENRHRYRFAYPVGEDPVTTEKDDGTTTLIAEAEKFTRRISQDEGGGEDHDYEALHDYMWSDSKKEVKPRDALYIFVYQLELKDENIKGKSEIELHNKATVAYGDKSKSDDAVVYFTPEVLKKEGMHTHEDPTNIDIMEYTIYVNPGATDMVTAEGGSDIGRFTLTDQMDEILELKLDSVKVSRVDKETGEETLLTQVTDINEVKPGADCYVVQEGKGNTLKLTLPDNAYLKITYSAYIGATMNTSGSVTNTVTMDADITITESNTAEYEMDGSGGRMSGNDIDGAVFEVYTLKKDGGGESADSKKLQVQINEGGQETFEQFGGDISPNAKTGAPIAPKEDYDGYYLLVEKAAPDGYVPDPKPVVFKFAEKKTETEEGKETVPEKETVKVKYFEEDEKNYHEYEVEVQYIQPGDNVVIFENKPDVYELPETGGFGSMTYTLAGLLLIFGGAFCLMYRRNRIQKGGW